MPIASARLAEYENGMVQATLSYNDSSLIVQSFTLVNNSDRTITVTFRKANAPEEEPIVVVLAPAPEDSTTIVTLDQIGGGWYYSPVELEEGDPDYGKPNVLIGFSDSPLDAAAAQRAGAKVVR